MGTSVVDDLAAEQVVSRRAWHTLFITSVSMMLVAMDVTIVSVALPGITRTFSSTSPTSLSWVFTAYNVTFAGLLLLAGKLGDRWGRKRAFLIALVIFLVASIAAATAPTAEILIAARLLQAGGAALIYPASLALLLPEFPLSRRSMAIGVWGGIAGLGAAMAPTIGALLVEWFGWRSVFFINVPFVTVAFIAGVRVLREAKGENPDEHFDPIAVPVAAIAVGLLVLAVVQGTPWGWGDGRVLACFVAAALLLPWFIVRSYRHPRPLLDLELFHSRSFTIGNLAQGLFVGSFFGWLVLMPSFFEKTWGWSALAAGFGLAPAPALSGVLSPLAGRLADRIGHRGLVVTGAIVGGLGATYWAVSIGPDPNYVRDVLPGSILLGLGGAAGFATLTGAIMSGVPPRFYSMAGAARSTIFQLASAIGIAIGVALTGTPAAGEVAPYARAWWMGAIGAFSAAAVSLALPARAHVHAVAPAVAVAD